MWSSPVVAVFLRMREHCDATGALESKIRTRAVIGLRGSGNSRGNLDYSKYVIVFCKGGRILTSDIRYILEPRASFGIDNT